MGQVSETPTSTSTAPAITTLGELRASGHEYRSVKAEIRSNLADRLRAGEGAYGQALALVGGKVLGGAGQGPLGLGGGRMGVHVCFLLRRGLWDNPSVGRRQTL